MVRICFLALNSYPILSDAKTTEFVGGAEVEYAGLADELVNLGYDISFVTYKERGFEGPEIEYIEDIEIIKTYPKYLAKRLSVFSKFQLVLKALKKANVDIYFGCGSPGILSFFSLLSSRMFVYRISSDIIASGGTYYSSQTRLLSYYLESLINRVELNRATTIIAQTEKQKECLEKELRIDSVMIRNGFPVEAPFDFTTEKISPPIVLWVGSISNLKQPGSFLELARRIPEIAFQMIGIRADKELQLYNLIKKKAQEIPNLDFIGFVPFSEIQAYYKRASLLVNTSIYEGFPMSFIQAWMNYTPTVSLKIDPDEIMKKERIGYKSNSISQLVTDVRTLMTDEKLEHMSQRARSFAVKEFDIKIIAQKYAKVFTTLLQN